MILFVPDQLLPWLNSWMAQFSHLDKWSSRFAMGTLPAAAPCPACQYLMRNTAWLFMTCLTQVSCSFLQFGSTPFVIQIRANSSCENMLENLKRIISFPDLCKKKRKSLIYLLGNDLSAAEFKIAIPVLVWSLNSSILSSTSLRSIKPFGKWSVLL